MTDTQEAMRKDFLNWLQQSVADTDCNVFQVLVGHCLVGHCDDDAWWAWQAATAQSAEKIADLDTIIGVQHTKLVAGDEKIAWLEGRIEHDDAIIRLHNERYEEMRKQLAAAELSNKQLQEALQWYVDEDDVIETLPGNEYWVNGLNRARELLAQPISIEALDVYVAGKMAEAQRTTDHLISRTAPLPPAPKE